MPRPRTPSSSARAATLQTNVLAVSRRQPPSAVSPSAVSRAGAAPRGPAAPRVIACHVVVPPLFAPPGSPLQVRRRSRLLPMRHRHRRQPSPHMLLPFRTTWSLTATSLPSATVRCLHRAGAAPPVLGRAALVRSPRRRATSLRICRSAGSLATVPLAAPRCPLRLSDSHACTSPNRQKEAPLTLTHTPASATRAAPCQSKLARLPISHIAAIRPPKRLSLCPRRQLKAYAYSPLAALNLTRSLRQLKPAQDAAPSPRWHPPRETLAYRPTCTPPTGPCCPPPQPDARAVLLMCRAAPGRATAARELH
jgi:hypothetical protein